MLDDVYAADEMFCTGTMGELAGVIMLDGRTIGSGEIGPLTQRLNELFAQRTGIEGTVVV
jgi:branched-chain amino acid aminotransferase